MLRRLVNTIKPSTIGRYSSIPQNINQRMDNVGQFLCVRHAVALTPCALPPFSHTRPNPFSPPPPPPRPQAHGAHLGHERV